MASQQCNEADSGYVQAVLPPVDTDEHLVLGYLLNETDAIASTWIKCVAQSDIALGISHLQASYQDQLVHSD